MQAVPPAPAQRRAQGTAYPTAAAWTHALARMPRRRVLPLRRHRHRAPRTASPTAVALMASARSERCNDGTEGLSRLFRRRPASSNAYPAGSTDALGKSTTPASAPGFSLLRALSALASRLCRPLAESAHARSARPGQARPSRVTQSASDQEFLQWKTDRCGRWAERDAWGLFPPPKRGPLAASTVHGVAAQSVICAPSSTTRLGAMPKYAPGPPALRDMAMKSS